jgi:hypothetical protein
MAPVTMADVIAQIRAWADALEHGATPYEIAQTMRMTATDLHYEHQDKDPK